MAPSKPQANGEKKGKPLKFDFNQKEIFTLNLSAARGRPQGSVKKPKQPKATKTKIKIAVKKTKEPKKKTENK